MGAENLLMYGVDEIRIGDVIRDSERLPGIVNNAV